MQLMLSETTRSSTDAAGIELSGVRRQLRFFIEQYRQGRRETTELVSIEGLNTRKHVSVEAERTSEAVELVGQKVDRLTALEGAQMGERVRERFLESLKYPGLNQRRNQIESAHKDTLAWIFVGDNHESQPGKNLHEGTHTKREDHPDEDLLNGIKWDSFSNWLKSTDTVYWISGKPASGKTTAVKYILEDERTKKHLNIWCPGCAIVSHYFWLPGSPMQRNMEGLLSSLLYQLLENNPNASMQVMSSVSGQKSSYTDWSNAELNSAVMRALDSYENGVCLFLDGIDEIKPEDGTKDGIPEFLDWAIELSQRSKIKLCLASRPDPHILETRLSRYPRLRLQDLNFEDLMAYAKGRVKIPAEAISAEKKNLIQSLADKAEGVFLWLILAIKSVNEGFRNDDSIETLQERIQCLPQSLDSLYKDMWARAGADNPSEYRQTAALYFKLILASKVIFNINAFDVMLATTCLADRVLHAFADRSKLVREDDMLQQCREVEKKLNIYCVGLIQTVSVPKQEYSWKPIADCSWYGQVYDRIVPVATRTRLAFIHRTASDFLNDTKSGREILGFDTSSDFSIECRLLHARLANLALIPRRGRSAVVLAQYLGTILHRWRHIGRELPQNWNRLVSGCEKLADSGRLLSGGGDFTCVCGGTQSPNDMGRTGSDDELFISRITNRSLSENEVGSFLLAFTRIDKIPSLFRTSCEMLRAGADLNWKGWFNEFHIPNGETRACGIMRTPWQRLLSSSVELLMPGTQSGSFDHTPPPTLADLTSLAEVFLLFVSEGARLNDPANLMLTGMSGLGTSPDLKRQKVISNLDRAEYHRAIYISIPAYMIVKLLTKTLRSFCSILDKESFPKVCIDLENSCENCRSGGSCRVLGKSELQVERPLGTGYFTWWETTHDVKTRLPSKLMEWLEGQHLLFKSVIEGGNGSEARRIDTEQTFQCIWDHESWTLRTRETGMSSIYERLIELGFMMRLEGAVDFSSMMGLVRQHNLENSRYGGTT